MELDAVSAPDLIGIIVSGYVRLQQDALDGRRQIVTLMTPGDIVGDAALNRQGYSLQTSTEVTLCQFDRPGFERLMKTAADLGRAVYLLRTAKLDQLGLMIWTLGLLSVEERVCAFLALCTKFMPYRVGVTGVGMLTLDLPRGDIADLLGTSPESISRITNRLDAAGVIHINSPRQFDIPDLDRLIAMGCLQDTFGLIEFPSGLAARRAKCAPVHTLPENPGIGLALPQTLASQGGGPATAAAHR